MVPEARSGFKVWARGGLRNVVVVPFYGTGFWAGSGKGTAWVVGCWAGDGVLGRVGRGKIGVGWLGLGLDFGVV